MAEFEDQLTAEYPYLERFAKRLTKNEHAGQDLTQDTMERALNAQTLYRPEAKMRSWLNQIMFNLFLDQVRKNKRYPTEELTLSVSSRLVYPSAETEAITNFGDQETTNLVIGLPDPYGKTLMLTDILGLKHTEVAEILGVPRPTVSSRAKRGRVILKDLLSRRISTL